MSDQNPFGHLYHPQPASSDQDIEEDTPKVDPPQEVIESDPSDQSSSKQPEQIQESSPEKMEEPVVLAEEKSEGGEEEEEERESEIK